MKKILLIAAAFMFGASAMAQQTADEVMKVNTEKIDFGKMKQNNPATSSFTITNKSNKPIVVENAWGSCGCTTPEVPKQPIAPNSSAKIKVAYNAAALGSFTKDVYVKLAGIQEPKIIKITGEVLDEAAYNAYAAKAKKAGTAVKKEKG